MSYMNLKILILPGDGIGAEVTSAAVSVLNAVAKKFGHTLEFSEGLIGGVAIHKTGTPLPKETLDKAQAADATLMGAVGLPEFDNAPAETAAGSGSARHSQSAGGVRESAARADLARADRFVAAQESIVVEGTDMIIVRELTGGLYYGQPRGIESSDRGFNTMSTRAWKSSASRVKLSNSRGTAARKSPASTSPNVLEVSQFWRKVVIDVAKRLSRRRARSSCWSTTPPCSWC